MILQIWWGEEEEEAEIETRCLNTHTQKENKIE